MPTRSGQGLAYATPDEALTLARGATFWSIERLGTHVARLIGATRGRSRVTLRQCASVPRARELLARAIAAKLDAGFRPAERPPGWPARRRPTVASSAAHDRALRRARDPSAALATYGAWLRAQGDPRGALVAANAAAIAGGVVASGCHACDANAAWFRRSSPRARHDRPPWWPAGAPSALDAHGPRAGRHRALLARYGRHIVGRAGAEGGPLRLGWRLGFVEIIHLDHPGGEADDEARAALRAALRLPAARFARAVDVAAPAEYEGEALFTDETFVRDALGGRALPSVASLSIGAWLDLNDEVDDPDFPPAEGWRREAGPVLGELGAAGRAFPRLDHLSVAGRGVGLDGLDLGRLRHAAFQFARPDEGAFGVVARADWRRLRSLRLAAGDLARPEHGSDVAAEVVALLEGRRAPELRHLRLEHVPLTDELCDVIGRSPLAGALVSLEIVCGEMTSDGVEALLRHRQRFGRLRALDVAHNALPDEALEALAKGFGRSAEVIAGAQLDAYARDDASDSEFVREEELRARGGRPDPLGGPARDDDEGDDIDGLLDAAVVLTSLRNNGEADETGDEADEVDGADGADGEAPAVLLDATDDEGVEGLDVWPLGLADDVPVGADDLDEGAELARGRRRRKKLGTRLAASRRPPTGV